MSAICSICGGSMTQAGEGTAACLACECAGLHERIEELEATLRAVEWVTEDGGDSESPRCPRCGVFQFEGHVKGCQLAAALKGGEDEREG